MRSSEGHAVGKSALARAIAEAMPAGSVVLWARSEEVERQLDFGVVDQLIRQAAAAELSSPPTIQRGNRQLTTVCVSRRTSIPS